MTQPEDTVREALEYANGLMQTGTTVYIGFPKALSALAALLAERDALREALKALHDETVEYQTINQLGGYNNHVMKQARAALAIGEKK